MAVGSPLIQGMILGHGECLAVAGHRAEGRATSHLHHREDPAPPYGDHDKSLGEIWGGEEGADLALGPSIGHADLTPSKHHYHGKQGTSQAWTSPPIQNPHSFTSLSVLFPRTNSAVFIL